MPAKLQGDQQVRQGGAGGPGHQEQFNQDSSVPVSIFDQHFPLFSLTLNFSEQSFLDLLSTPAPLVWQETVQPDLLASTGQGCDERGASHRVQWGSGSVFWRCGCRKYGQLVKFP